MDTKPLELEALNLIQSLVSRFGFRYTNPNYDKDGGDFLIVKEKNNGLCYVLRCQSKGRDVACRPSNVEIPQKYVVDNFIVFVYVRPEDVDDTKVYLYTAEEICTSWGLNENKYILYLPKDFTRREENVKYLLNKERAEIIRDILDKVVSCQTSDGYLSALSDTDFHFTMWRKLGCLPSIEYIRDVFAGDVFYYVGLAKFIFLLCASVIKNDSSDFSLSIDWAFLCLKELSGDDIQKRQYEEGKAFYSDVAVTYNKTWVKELLSSDVTKQGFHLHIGDAEESVDAFVFKDGEYSIVYNGCG